MRDVPVPGSTWAMRQTWSDLLFLHWRVPQQTLRELIPAPLELDTYYGDAFIAVVPFLMTGIRLHWLPPVPGTTRTLELNVRTYVRYGERAGVYFLSLDAENSIIVHTARRWYGLPYHKAQMELKKSTYTRYNSQRTHAGSTPANFRAVYRPITEPRQYERGSLEYFLTERYCLFTTDPKGNVAIGDIDHRPWPLRKAEYEIETNTMTLPHGITVDDRPIAHYAASIDVNLWPMVAAGSCSAGSPGQARDPYKQSR